MVNHCGFMVPGVAKPPGYSLETTGKVSETSHSQGEQEYQRGKNAISLPVSSFAFCDNNGKNDTVIFTWF